VTAREFLRYHLRMQYHRISRCLTPHFLIHVHGANQYLQ
jgi:hypothetical protein